LFSLRKTRIGDSNTSKSWKTRTGWLLTRSNTHTTLGKFRWCQIVSVPLHVKSLLVYSILDKYFWTKCVIQKKSWYILYVEMLHIFTYNYHNFSKKILFIYFIFLFVCIKIFVAFFIAHVLYFQSNVVYFQTTCKVLVLFTKNKFELGTQKYWMCNQNHKLEFFPPTSIVLYI